MLDGLADMDGGALAVDLHQVFGIDLTDELLDSKTWQWLVARCYRLLDLNTMIRREATRGV